jgi:excisionase family DNA binding protein
MKNDVKNTLNVIKPGDKMMTRAQAAVMTEVSEKEISRAVREGELRLYIFGKESKRLLLSEVQEWWKTKISIEKTENDQ